VQDYDATEVLAAIRDINSAATPLAASPHGTTHGGGIDYSKAEETPFGRAADPRRAQRTIRVDMSDAMRFAPAAIEVKRGERIRFVVTNSGRVMHEMVLGALDELKAHGELMKKFPNMAHDEPHMVHVACAEAPCDVEY
jgi:uncharacterized cupredoxin-like copper-binding protein